MTKIADQIHDALTNAVENGYPHESQRNPKCIVLEIHDWSGFENFDHNDVHHVQIGIDAVIEWRLKHSC